jgi:SAM-dependent methyltransferase
MDAAAAMLERAREVSALDLVRGDAFALPFAASSFGAVTALRLVFHFEPLDRLLAEMRRVVGPGGRLVFDTYVWSPRALLPLDRARWGGGVYVHSPRTVQDCARSMGLRVARRETCFLFSPYLYRRLPLAAVKLLDRVERLTPSRLHARVFWQLERVD